MIDNVVGESAICYVDSVKSVFVGVGFSFRRVTLAVSRSGASHQTTRCLMIRRLFSNIVAFRRSFHEWRH